MVILANDPPLLRGMLERALRAVPDLRVAAETADLEDLLSLVDQTNAEWVIVSLTPDGEMPGLVEALLARRPSLSILAVAADGKDAQLRWLEPQRHIIHNLTLPGLVDVLRRLKSVGCSNAVLLS